MLNTKKRLKAFLVLLAVTATILAVECNVYFPGNIRVISGEEVKFPEGFAYTLDVSGNIESYGDYDATVKLLGLIPVKEVTVNVVPEIELLPVGKAVGIKMFTKGLICVGTQSVKSETGENYNIAKGLNIQQTDIIESANGEELYTVEQFSQIVESSFGDPVTLVISKNGKRERKNIVSVSKASAKDKRKHVDEKFSKLSLRERIYTSIKDTVEMSGLKMNVFWFLVALSMFVGIGIGKFLFSDNLLAFATGIAIVPVPYIVFKVRARWYIRNRDEQLENTMNLITNSYLGCNDIIKAVNENLDKLDSPKPFAEFVTDVTLIDSNIKRALMKLELKIKNKYFSEWIDILVLAQEKSGDYRFILPAVVQSMNDAKRLQIEADTVMMAVWRDYFTSIVLSFSIIPLLKWSNATWFEILVGSMVGKLLIILMLIMTVISSFITLKINKPL